MNNPKEINFSDGSKYVDPIIVIAPDLHSEAAVAFRAFWTQSLDASTMCPVIGYCSSGGSYREQWRVINEVRRLYPDADIYYENGRKAKL